MAHIGEELLDLVALARLVLRAGVFHDGQPQCRGGGSDLPLPTVNERPDLPHVRAGHIGHRLEAADAPFKEQTHQKGLHSIVVVMTEGELVAAEVVQRGVERAAAHLGAERAGIVLLPHVEHDLLDVRRDDGVRNVQLAAHLRDGRIVHPRKAEVDREPDEVKMQRVIALQMLQRAQEQQRVLAAGNADGNAVALGDHAVFVHALADEGGQFVQYVSHSVFLGENRLKNRK